MKIRRHRHPWITPPPPPSCCRHHISFFLMIGTMILLLNPVPSSNYGGWMVHSFVLHNKHPNPVNYFKWKKYRPTRMISSIQLQPQSQEEDFVMNDDNKDHPPDASDLEEEIKQLRIQAQGMLQSLEDKVTSSSDTATETIPMKTISSQTITTVDTLEISTTSSSNPSHRRPSSPSSSLLEDTQWKIVLNIGREPGTWMPSTWGKSGDRLLMSLQVIFTSSQLYERDEFLGGVGGSRVLHVVDQQLTLAPSLKQGIQTFPIKNGGWRIVYGEGPAGSDILRFFFELEDTISSQSDIYCPKGRIYCNCGYFPKLNQGNTKNQKEYLRKELDQLQLQAEQIQQEIEADPLWIFSVEKIKKNVKLFQLQATIRDTITQFNYASIIQPDASILSFTTNKEVALTKEGGVSCKVTKALVEEYHILGRFVIKG